jgi:iron-sulfur cluster repair protein YtfE (RIC family)
MHTLRDFMARDHLHCDRVFVGVERLVLGPDWDAAQATFARFQALTLQHFEAEETLLFPAFEARTGMTQGPTAVMRAEHVQIRQLMDAALTALRAHDADDYTGYSETLSIMLQQHNMKEENVLYPMCDQHLAQQVAPLLEQLAQRLPEGAA